jgi:hypothetical protein
MRAQLLAYLVAAVLALAAPARRGDISPDHRWKIEISSETHTDPKTGFTSVPHGRLTVRDLRFAKDEVVWDENNAWLPASADSARAIWRSDSHAFTLPDVARKWNGFSVYVLDQGKWVQAYQSNDFIDRVPSIWHLTTAQFNAAQLSGCVTDLKWKTGGRITLKFWSFDKTDTLITEKVVDENTKPQVIYVDGKSDPSAVPPLQAQRVEVK